MQSSRRPHASGGASDHSIISSLRATRLIESKSFLPAELIPNILDLLPLSDLMSFARTSKKMLEMVYDDSRWVKRLKAMGVWNEDEARKRNVKAMSAEKEFLRKKLEGANSMDIKIYGNNRISDLGSLDNIYFETGIGEERQSLGNNTYSQNNSSHSLSNFSTPNQISINELAVYHFNSDPETHLNIFSEVKSIRGSARLEFAKIYAVLAPYYDELVRSEAYTKLAIFINFPRPEQQAQMLANQLKFSKCDWALGWKQREEKLLGVIRSFESNAFQEFECGYFAGDIDGRMHKYAHVLGILNGGQLAVDYFVQKLPMFNDQNILGSPLDCINQASADSFSLEPFKRFLNKIMQIVNEQSEIIDRIFPPGIDVLQILIDKFTAELLEKYVIPLVDEVHERSIASYAKAVPYLFEQSIRFGLSLKSSKNSSQNFHEKVKATIARVFEPLSNPYLLEELKYFKKTAETEVEEWENKLSAQDATTESYFMASVNRQSDKKDFLTSFKKVVMMPIHVLPLVSTFTSKPTPTQYSPSRANLQVSTSQASWVSQPPGIHRSNSPVLQNVAAQSHELAAKASLMASRLEGIRSLFSIELALNLIHAAKAGIERLALFTILPGQAGEKAGEQCSAIYVLLLQILGERHVQSGFDKAIDHLSKYNPREELEHQRGVASLVTFLELVNVGDLISQMLDVFYEQQLCANKLTDRNDCFEPAARAKKHFEQMLDKRVAAGLNKGIDVLMDEVEYLCATVQLPTDYNPTPTSDGNFEVGPSNAAKLIVSLVESHTKMLAGSADKNMLDVFNQEVGLRLFTVLCRHLKRQRISVNGSMRLISDMNLYFLYIKTLRNKELLEYFQALKAVSQIYLIAPEHAKEIAEVIADTHRFGGLFRAEDVYEFIERRADWYSVKKSVEKAMYGIGCLLM